MQSIKIKQASEKLLPTRTRSTTVLQRKIKLCTLMKQFTYDGNILLGFQDNLSAENRFHFQSTNNFSSYICFVTEQNYIFWKVQLKRALESLNLKFQSSSKSLKFAVENDTKLVTDQQFKKH